MLEPIYEEKIIGHARIMQIFKASGVGNIAGCIVEEGRITKEKALEIIEKEERNGCHPRKLGAAICEIVERTNPPFRTKVGPWIQVLFARSKKWLPDAVMQCALRIFYAIK